MQVIKEMLNYPFIVRALIVGVIVSLCASLLGVSLVLKRYSMIGDGLSHVSFGALSVAVAFGLSPLHISIPMVTIAALVLLKINENAKIKSDSAIAIFSTSFLALGVIVTSVTTGLNTDVCNYMFGSILAMKKSDVQLSIILSIVVIALFIICYNKLFAVTFDETFAKATGVHVSFYNTLIAVLTSITIVLGMRMMGAMLISSLVIFPALSSMRLFKHFKAVVICSGFISIISFCIGLVVSYVYSLPVGASIVMIDLAILLIFSLLGMMKSRGFLNKRFVSLASMVVIIFSVSIMSTGCSNTPTVTSLGTRKASESDLKDLKQGGSESSTTENSGNSSITSSSSPNSSPNSSSGITPSNTIVGNTKIDVDITEKLYVTYINEVYVNSPDYLSKTIRLQGMYTTEYYDSTKTTYHYVYRNGPGCCGNDGAMCGFEFIYNGTMPADNSWIEVVGTLQSYLEDGYVFLRLNAQSVTVKTERGAEVVVN